MAGNILLNHFVYDSRDAANRTPPWLPVESQFSSDSRHVAFVHADPRNVQQLPEAVVAVPDSGVLNEERVHELRRGHVE